MLKFYGYKNCSSCRNAEKLLAAKKVAYESIDITQSPPSAQELSVLVQTAGIDIKKYLNTSGEVYRSMGLKDKLKSLSQAELIQLLAGNGRLIKRPLITDGRRVTLGFKADELSLWQDA